MARQQLSHRIDARDGSLLESARAEMFLHEPARGLPFVGADSRGNAAVGNDFDAPIRELHIDQDPIVVFGIPDAQRGKQF